MLGANRLRLAHLRRGQRQVLRDRLRGESMSGAFCKLRHGQSRKHRIVCRENGVHVKTVLSKALSVNVIHHQTRSKRLPTRSEAELRSSPTSSKVQYQAIANAIPRGAQDRKLSRPMQTHPGREHGWVIETCELPTKATANIVQRQQAEPFSVRTKSG